VVAAFHPLAALRASLAETSVVAADSLPQQRPGAVLQVEEDGGRVGFITPMTHSFCDTLQPGADRLLGPDVSLPR